MITPANPMVDEPRTAVLRVLRAFGHERWVPEGIRALAIAKVFDPDSSGALSFEVNFYGYRYVGMFNCTIDWYVYFFGEYSRRELFLLRDLLNLTRNKTVLDVGANVGHHSLYLSRFARYVHAFEPWGVVRRRLLERITLNSITNITVHDVGLSDRNALLNYYAPTNANTGSGSFNALHDCHNQLSEALPVVRGDDYLDSMGVNNVGLIKIDVEGWEKYVLLGLQQTIAKNRPIILMELSPTTRASFGEAIEIEDYIPGGYQIRACREGTFRTTFGAVGPGFHGNIVLCPTELLKSVTGRQQSRLIRDLREAAA
jgi:FkbM family methyltransferase